MPLDNRRYFCHFQDLDQKLFTPDCVLSCRRTVWRIGSIGRAVLRLWGSHVGPHAHPSRGPLVDGPRDDICHKHHKQRLCKIIITRVKVHFVDVF